MGSICSGALDASTGAAGSSGFGVASSAFTGSDMARAGRSNPLTMPRKRRDWESFRKPVLRCDLCVLFLYFLYVTDFVFLV